MFNSKNVDRQSDLVLSAVYFSVFTAIVILMAKVFAWYLTSSTTVLASLVDSLLDVVASVINYIAARYASRPPDDEHRFGHGRAEDLAIFIQASLFGISGVIILVQSIKHMVFPRVMEHENVAIWVMVFSIVLTSILLLYQFYVFRQTRSNIVKCDSLHYTVDLFTNAFVILALFLSYRFDSVLVDPIFASCIGLYMLYGAMKLVRGTFDNLMDHEFDKKEKKKLNDIILSHKDVRGYHDLKTRHAGSKSFIQFHLELDGSISLNKAHRIAELVEDIIHKEFQRAEILIHQDPAGVDEETQFHD